MLIRTSKSQMRFSRRNLLIALGAGAALLPMIEADPADAAQCYVGGIKRLFIFGWADGMLSNVSTWATAGATPSAWKVASFQSVPPSGPSLLPGMPAKSLADYQSDLILLHGIDYDFTNQPNPNGGEHNGHSCFPGMLTGSNYQSLVASTSNDVAGGISIDQYIANQMVASGYKGIPSLSLGVFVKSTGHLSWKGAGQVVLPNDDPYNVFTTYFAGKLPTTYGGDAGAPAASDAGTGTSANKVGKSILDYVLADLNRYSNVVGSADKITIQNHMQSVRDMEQTLAGIGTVGIDADGGVATAASGGCGTAAVAATSAATGKLDISNTSNIPTLLKLQFDMSAAAFAADMTRVIVCQCGDQGDANLILSWLGFPTTGPPLASDPNTGNTNGFHAIAHRNDADKTTCDQWFQQQLAYMIGNMKSVTDPTGASILDNSLFLAMNNMRTGTHETTTVPVVMAGSLGGYFKTGQSLALSGVNNNRLLLSVLNGFGYPLTTFGTASYCSGGPLTQLNA
jgi:Protein of unknown function (DUF1552)